MSRHVLLQSAVSIPLMLAVSTQLYAQTETQTFDSEDSAAATGWTFNEEGQSTERYLEGETEDNRCRVDAPCETNLGWKESNFAGGDSAGEGGGLVHRSGKLPVGFYADTTIGELTLDMPITASGKVSLHNMNANGHYHFGFFDAQRVIDDPLDFGAHLGFLIGEPGGGVQPNFRWGHAVRTDGELLQNEHDAFDLGALPGESLEFVIDYDPTTSSLLLEIGDDGPAVFALPDTFRDDGATLTAFGIWTATTPSNARPRYMEIFLDDITYSSIGSATIPGDLNMDGSVDAADAGIMFGNWGTVPPADPVADLNDDGIVDAADAGTMFGNWTGDASVVPEPTMTWAWAFLVLPGLIGRRRRA